MLRTLALLALLVGSCTLAPAQAETTLCTRITTLPAVIATQGVYCLTENLETAITSGSAITIDASNVTLDCNDWKIGGLQAGPATTTYGIVVSHRDNVTIRHCALRGFRIGLFLGVGGETGHVVEDNRLDGITSAAIWLRGDGTVVRRNRVTDTGGAPAAAVADGIIVEGDGSLVSGNIVSGMSVTGVNGAGSTYAFRLLGNDDEVSDNLITGLVATGSGDARGLYGFKNASYRDNTVIGNGVQSFFAIVGGQGQSVCSGNRVHGFSNGIFNCIDGGGNAAN